MYNTTGFTHDQITYLLSDLEASGESRKRQSKLDTREKITITLAYLRRNRTQADLGEHWRVSQPTVSRIVSTFTPILAAALKDWAPTADDLPDRTTYVVDGTLAPNWSWKKHPEDYSGKHRATGLNLQVACTLSGRLAWVSDPLPGSVHDANAIRLSGLLDAADTDFVADKGYIGLGVITPVRKKPGQCEVSRADKEDNTSVNRIRWVIEKAIAQLKTWRILHTDYRRPRTTHPTTITAILGLEFYKMSLTPS
jgi:hypothetical protein